MCDNRWRVLGDFELGIMASRVCKDVARQINRNQRVYTIINGDNMMNRLATTSGMLNTLMMELLLPTFNSILKSAYPNVIASENEHWTRRIRCFCYQDSMQ